jgi:hypothetical protein
VGYIVQQILRVDSAEVKVKGGDKRRENEREIAGE